MKHIVPLLAVVAWLSPSVALADQEPAKGKLLVATELVGGDIFNQTVVLLAHYDETGAIGIVINRPTDIPPREIASDVEAFSDYSGTLYWGGPVQMGRLLALMRTDTPPEDSEPIIDSVHQVRVDDGLKGVSADPGSLRFFIGYAGWSAGQLDHEIARGSWHVLPATVEHVFAEDPRSLWKRLAPQPELRVDVAGTGARKRTRRSQVP
jgi:putative transcriptional regulator